MLITSSPQIKVVLKTHYANKYYAMQEQFCLKYSKLYTSLKRFLDYFIFLTEGTHGTLLAVVKTQQCTVGVLKCFEQQTPN